MSTSINPTWVAQPRYNSQGQATIFILPQELLIRIFSYLSALDLVYAGEVCKEWYYFSHDNTLWKNQLQQQGRFYSSVGSLKALFAVPHSLAKKVTTVGVRVLTLNTKNFGMSTCLTRKENLMAAGFLDHSLVVYDLEKQTRVAAFNQGGHIKRPTALTLATQKGPHLLSASLQGDVKLWDVKTTSCVTTFSAEKEDKTLFTLYDTTLFSTTSNTLHNWDIEREALVRVVDTMQDRIIALTATYAHEGVIVTGSEDQNIKCWDFKNLKNIFNIPCNYSVHSIASFGNRLAISGGANTITLYDIRKPCTCLKVVCLANTDDQLTALTLYGNTILAGIQEHSKVHQVGVYLHKMRRWLYFRGERSASIQTIVPFRDSFLVGYEDAFLHHFNFSSQKNTVQERYAPSEVYL